MSNRAIRRMLAASAVISAAALLTSCFAPTPDRTDTPAPTVTAAPRPTPAPGKTEAPFDPVGTAAGDFSPLILPSDIPHGLLTGPIDPEWLQPDQPEMGEMYTVTLANHSSPEVFPSVAVSIDSISENLPAGPERDLVVAWTGAEPGAPAAAPEVYAIQRVVLRIREFARSGTGDITAFEPLQSVRFLNFAGETVEPYPGDGQFGCTADATPFAEYGLESNATVQLCVYVAASPSTFNRSEWVTSIITDSRPDAAAGAWGTGSNTLVVTDKRPERPDGE